MTGGASGLGLALGERCAALGMDVALLDLDGERAGDRGGPRGRGARRRVRSAWRSTSPTAASVDAAAAAVDERFGVADLVVSNVGVQLFGAVESFTDDEWRWLLDVNVIGSARVARAFLPLLRRAERPQLAFTTSSSILDPASRLGAYQASKFAVWGLAETLRLELADDGIGVSVIFPSGMITRHLETSEAAQPAPPAPTHRRRRRLRRHDREQPRDGRDARHPRGRRRRRDRSGAGRRALRHHPRRPHRRRQRAICDARPRRRDRPGHLRGTTRCS